MLRPTVSQTQQVTSYLVPCLKELIHSITAFEIEDYSLRIFVSTLKIRGFTLGRNAD